MPCQSCIVLLTLLLSFCLAGGGYLRFCRNPDEQDIASDEILFGHISLADYVFSGKVTSMVPSSDSSRIVFDVQVKRFFKSPGLMEGRGLVRVAKRREDGEGTECRGMVRVRYTAIFVGGNPRGNVSKEGYRGDSGEVDSDVDVLLDISPVSITLKNLDRVNYATKGM